MPKKANANEKEKELTLEEKLKINKKRGYFAVAGCLMIDLAVGEFNLLSHLYPYFSSYYHLYNPNLQNDDLKYISILWQIFQSITLPIGIIIYTKVGFRLSFLLFVLTFSISQFICSYITNMWLFIFVYGAFAGISQGGYVLPLYCCWRYFHPSKKTIISGILLSAYALAPIPNSFLALKLVNPDNVREIELPDGRKFFPEDVAKNVPFFLRTFAIMVFSLGVFGILFIKEPIEINESEEQQRSMASQTLLTATQSDDLSESVLKLNNSGGIGRIGPNVKKGKIRFKKSKIEKMKWSDLKIFKNKHFLNAYFIMLIEYLYPLFLLFAFKKIAFDYGRSDEDVTIAGIIGALFNAISRFTAGFIFQKKGYFAASMVIMTLEVVSALTFVASTKNEIAFSASLSGFLSCYGGLLGLYPLVSDNLFSNLGAFSYSILMSSFTLSNLVILSIGEKLRDMLGGWGGLMYLLAGFAVLPILNIWFLDREIKRKQREEAVGVA